jgi:ABC-2 type transport system permease protein
MNILKIILKGLKQDIRDKRTMAIMIAFPIALIIILGAAFTNAFGESLGISFNAKVLYKIETDKPMAEAFNSFKDGFKDSDLKFTETSDALKAKEQIENVEYDCFITVKDKEITILKNDKYNLQADIFQSMLDAFIQSYNLQVEIAKENPAALSNISYDEGFNAVDKVSLDRKRTPRSIDYYAVTMISLIILYGSMGGSYGIIGERTRKTEGRMLTAPVRKTELLAAKVIGSVLITVFQITVVVLVSKFILKVYFGENMLPIVLILLSEIIMAVSLGVGTAFLVKNESAINGILNAIIPFIAFLGGAYVPLKQFGDGFLLKLTNISPLMWVNRSIVNTIYSGDTSTVLQTVVINLVIATIFILLSSGIFRKEAA